MITQSTVNYCFFRLFIQICLAVKGVCTLNVKICKIHGGFLPAFTGAPLCTGNG
jgi:formyltetrahydrofolate hydrolase